MRYQPQGLQRLDPGARLRRGLVSYLPMAGVASRDAVDLTAWAPGVISSPIAFGGAPRGHGLRLKGANPAYFSRPNPTGSTSSTQPVTIRFRLFINAPLTGTAVALFSWANSSRDGAPCLYTRVTSGGLSVYTNVGYHPASLSALATQTEYIVTHVFDGTTHYEYLNGVQQYAAAGSWVGNMTTMFLGTGYDGTLGATTDVIMSDVAIWNRALSPADVVSDAQNPWSMFLDPYEDDEFFIPATVVVPALDLGTASSSSTTTGAATLSSALQLAAGAACPTRATAALSSAVPLSAAGVVASVGGAAVQSGVVLQASASTVTVGTAALAASGAAWSASSACATSASAASWSGVLLACAAIQLSAGSAALTTTPAGLAAAAVTRAAGAATLTAQVTLGAIGAAAQSSAAALSSGVLLAGAGVTPSSGTAALSTAAAAWQASAVSASRAAADLLTAVRMRAAGAMLFAGGAALAARSRVPTIPDSGAVLQVAGEDRVLRVDAENRILRVSAENRNVKVSA